MSEFHFLRPLWLLALLPHALLCWRMLRRGGRAGAWENLIEPALLPHILVHHRVGRRGRFVPVVYALGGLLGIVALAGPVWERLPAPVFRDDAALVIALDLSRTMDAADIKPSRLERARFKVADILAQRKDGLFALLVYSGGAFTVTPLTDDAHTIKAQLSALSSALMPAQGSRADLALDLAERLLKQSGLTHGDVLLITSGVNLTRAEPAAERLAGEGYRVSVLGAGGLEGAPVPLPQGGFLEDTQGNIIVSKLAAPALQQLARSGRGFYETMTAENSDIAQLLAFMSRSGRGAEGAEGQTKMDLWEERGPWLLLPLLPLAALAFRRGYLALLLCLLPMPDPAHALEWQDLWRTPDQQARQNFEAGDAAKAAETFQRPDWKAAAQYKAGQFKESVATLDGQSGALAQYNLGNALARQGRYPEAIQAYDRALAQNPGDEDARYNKELVEKALQEQKKQQQQDQKGQGKDKSDEKQDGKDQKDQHSQQDSSEESQSGDEGKDQKQPDPSQEQNGKENEGQQGQQGQQPEQGNKERESDQPQTGQGKEQDKAELQEPESRGESNSRPNEEQQASEQWLRRIPDDPGGLLKRKFYYQYQQRQGQGRGRQP
ncbi:VWA domain-containing protein [Methyloterricola oryzae]|uniref:VWA domain-containing protein n=1 Tax=Methyloterricola oryzae TaxID=1495050 RepID=UPI0005EBCF4F|nr:VWA domain-containing protein [Methyloterricola oryzae]